MGSKSPLSYQNYFTIETVYNKVYYKYMMRKGSNGPEIDLIEKNDTTKNNGTSIIISIKNNTDLLKFLKECYHQLYYFSNVVFDVKNISNSYNLNEQIYINRLTNDYNIIEGEHFLYRKNSNPSDNTKNDLHLSIGNVKYNIDWVNLGLEKNDYNINIGLKFNIGDLTVISTREDIRYTENNIKKIKNKIKLVKEELTKLLNKQNSNENITNIVDFKKKLTNYNFLKLFENYIPKSLYEFDNIKFPDYKNLNVDKYNYYKYINLLDSHSSIFRLRLKNLKKITDCSFSKTDYFYYYINNSLCSYYSLFSFLKEIDISKIILINNDDKLTNLKKNYIKNNTSYGYILNSDSTINLDRRFLTKEHFSKESKKIIKILLNEIKEKFKNVANYKDIKIPKDEKITVKKPKSKFKVSSFENNFKKGYYYDLKEFNSVGLVIKNEDEKHIKNSNLLFLNKKIRSSKLIYSVSPTNYEKLKLEKKNNPKLKYTFMEDIMKSNKIQYKLIPKILACKKLLTEYSFLNDNRYLEKLLSFFSLEIFKEDNILKKCIKDIYIVKKYLADEFFSKLLDDFILNNNLKEDTLYIEPILNFINSKYCVLIHYKDIKYGQYIYSFLNDNDVENKLLGKNYKKEFSMTFLKPDENSKYYDSLKDELEDFEKALNSKSEKYYSKFFNYTNNICLQLIVLNEYLKKKQNKKK